MTRSKETVMMLVSECFSQFRTYLAQRVGEVNSVTEREVLAAGAGVARIVEIARNGLGRTRDLALRLGTGGEEGISASIAAQAEMVSEHQRVMRERLRMQDEIATRTTQHVRSIQSASMAIARLTVEARVLALNAKIEASRASNDTRGFATVATEMQRLSIEIARTNQLVEELTQALGESLPELARHAHELRELSDGFSERIEKSIAQLDVKIGALDSAAHDAMRTADGVVHDVLAESHEVLSHLQFQDVVAQGLRRIETRYDGFQREVGEAAELSVLVETAPAAVHEEIGGEKSVETSGAGEVLLF